MDVPWFYQLSPSQKVAIYSSKEFREQNLIAADFWLYATEEFQQRILQINDQGESK